MRIDVRPCSTMPWFVEFRFAFNRSVVANIKRIPGCRWEPDARCWLVPVEVYQLIKKGHIVLEETEHGSSDARNG
jgi:hypothetical protein